MSGCLAVRGEGAAQHHVLEGRPVERDSRLELLLHDGTWVAGRYDWSGSTARWPGLRVDLGCVTARGVQAQAEGGRPVSAVLALPPAAVLRWPPGRSQP